MKDPSITISGEGLKDHLENIMLEIIKKVQLDIDNGFYSSCSITTENDIDDKATISKASPGSELKDLDVEVGDKMTALIDGVLHRGEITSITIASDYPIGFETMFNNLSYGCSFTKKGQLGKGSKKGCVLFHGHNVHIAGIEGPPERAEVRDVEVSSLLGFTFPTYLKNIPNDLADKIEAFRDRKK